MKYHTLFFSKLEKMSQNLSSAAVVIGALNSGSSANQSLQRAWFTKGQNRPCYKNGLFLDMLLNGVFK